MAINGDPENTVPGENDVERQRAGQTLAGDDEHVVGQQHATLSTTTVPSIFAPRCSDR